MGMRRNQFLGGIGKCMCFLVVCVMTFSSCYNDDDLKNSISGLEDRMDKLEASLQSVQTDISTLKTLTDALSQNKSIASVLENEDGSYTIKFSDQTEVTIRNGALIRLQKSGRFRQTVERLGNLRVCMHPAKGRGIPLFSVE